jgi:hypothetical protein
MARRIKKRNYICTQTLSGETSGVNIIEYEDQVKEIKTKMLKYSPKNIFNMDESGLFFRAIPQKTLASKRNSGYKKDKERLTIVFCCNSDGCEKRKLSIIGQSKKPRCFTNFAAHLL